jgi:hypothetical protein
MYSGNTGIFPNTPSWRPAIPPATNTSSSLSSLEIPGFQSSQSQTRTLNQMQSMQGSAAPSNLGMNNVPYLCLKQMSFDIRTYLRCMSELRVK